MRLIDAEALLRELFGPFNNNRMFAVDMRDLINAAPTIEPTAPDRVLASDVVKGIDAQDAEGYAFSVGIVDNGLARIVDGDEKVFLSRPMVADMLQGCLERGERVDWPDGSPGCRFRKAEAEPPTLLEVLGTFLEEADIDDRKWRERLEEAIEREKAKQERAQRDDV